MNGTDEASDFPNAESLLKSRVWQIAFWLTVLLCVISFMGSAPLFFRGELFRLAFLSPLIMLCCLIGAYGGFGHHIFRWVIVVVFTGVLGWYATFSARSPVFVVLVFGVVGVTVATTLILRVWKGSLIRVDTKNQRADALQFRIRDLLIWTTVVAILIAIGKAIWTNPLRPNVDILPILIGLPVCFGVATVINIWALFGNQIIVLRLMLVIAVTLISAFGCYLLMPDYWLFVKVAIINQILAVAIMFTVRGQGFRFLKRDPGGEIS